MPSKRKQFNIRLRPEAEMWMEELRVSIKAATGVDYSQADVIHTALASLRKKYPPVTEDRPRKKGGGT